jgi:hypothetical protein
MASIFSRNRQSKKIGKKTKTPNTILPKEVMDKRAFTPDSGLPVNRDWRGFPTKHPQVPDPTGTGKTSNVRLSTYEHGGQHYVIPSMVEGKDLSKNFGALRHAMEQGLEKYPWFNTAREALEWSKREHGNIDPSGRWKRAPKQ